MAVVPTLTMLENDAAYIKGYHIITPSQPLSDKTPKGVERLQRAQESRRAG